MWNSWNQKYNSLNKKPIEIFEYVCYLKQTDIMRKRVMKLENELNINYAKRVKNMKKEPYQKRKTRKAKGKYFPVERAY